MGESVTLAALTTTVKEMEDRVAALEKIWGTPVARAAAHCQAAGIRR